MKHRKFFGRLYVGQIGTFYGHDRIHGLVKTVTGRIIRIIEARDALFLVIKDERTQRSTFLVDPVTS